MFVRETLALHSIAPDLIPQDAPSEVWSDGFNVLFRNGESFRSPGDTPTLPGAAASPRTCVFMSVGGGWLLALREQ